MPVAVVESLSSLVASTKQRCAPPREDVFTSLSSRYLPAARATCFAVLLDALRRGALSSYMRRATRPRARTSGER